MKNWSTFEGAIQDFQKSLVSKLFFIHYWSIIGQLLANYWAIMDFFKTFTFFGTLYCLWIQSTSPHTLDSIHLIKRHCIIEENEKLAHVWGSHPRFCKSFGIKINLYSLYYWPIIDQFNGFFQNFYIFWNSVLFSNPKYITTHPGLDPFHINVSYHWRKSKIGPRLRESLQLKFFEVTRL